MNLLNIEISIPRREGQDPTTILQEIGQILEDRMNEYDFGRALSPGDQLKAGDSVWLLECEGQMEEITIG